ncbi:hypothetical protein EDC01DRAFT_640946 [Geopyxis carbonaria]|nr:hypothetical protein EDC01DRAFT_640946 [Geopyxis carbonaria]
MCQYYRHLWPDCGHVVLVFAKHCPVGARYQRPCAQREVWQTFKIDSGVDCRPCGGVGNSGIKMEAAAEGLLKITNEKEVEKELLFSYALGRKLEKGPVG